MTYTIQNHIFILMGVSGSGKSAVANAVAYQLSAAFLDGDFLHPRTNIYKMLAGNSLTDHDRAPWLNAISNAAFAMKRTNAISIIVCSALKMQYRNQLRKGNDYLSFIYLRGHFDLINRRMKERKGHFFKPQMLISQFEILEEPRSDETDVYAINIDQSLEKVIYETTKYIKSIIIK